MQILIHIFRCMIYYIVNFRYSSLIFFTDLNILIILFHDYLLYFNVNLIYYLP